MNAFTRRGVSLCMGFVVAMGLFWMMNGLISRGDAGIGQIEKRPMARFIRADELENKVRERDRQKPEPPREPQPIPRLEAMPVPQQPATRAPTFDLPTPDFRMNLALAGVPVAAPPPPAGPMGPQGLATYTRSLTPVHQVPPRYPRGARMRGISGWVRLEMVVREDGSVRDVRVVEAEPERGIFDQEAIRALTRWRFHPQMQEGRAIPALATITIQFQLEG